MNNEEIEYSKKQLTATEKSSEPQTTVRFLMDRNRQSLLREAQADSENRGAQRLSQLHSDLTGMTKAKTLKFILRSDLSDGQYVSFDSTERTWISDFSTAINLLPSLRFLDACDEDSIDRRGWVMIAERDGESWFDSIKVRRALQVSDLWQWAQRFTASRGKTIPED